MKEPYQDANDRWVVYDGVKKTVFNTKMEADVMVSKVEFAQKVQTLATTLVEAAESSSSLLQRSDDCGFGANESNEIVDGDISSTGMSAAQLAAALTCLDHYIKFMVGETVTPEVHRVTLNSIRK